MNEIKIEEQLAIISRKLDRITNPFKVAGLQFTAGIFHSFGNLVGTVLIAAIAFYVFSSLNIADTLTNYIKSLVPQPQINIQSPF